MDGTLPTATVTPIGRRGLSVPRFLLSVGPMRFNAGAFLGKGKEHWVAEDVPLEAGRQAPTIIDFAEVRLRPFDAWDIHSPLLAQQLYQRPGVVCLGGAVAVSLRAEKEVLAWMEAVYRDATELLFPATKMWDPQRKATVPQWWLPSLVRAPSGKWSPKKLRFDTLAPKDGRVIVVLPRQGYGS